MLAKAKKEKINNQIEVLERKSNQPNAIIKDLVASFLIPNIQREKLQRKGRIKWKLFNKNSSSKRREKIY